MNDHSANNKTNGTGRRRFLGFAWVGMLAVLAAESVAAVLRFLRPVSTGGFGSVVHAGAVDEFPPGSVNTIKAGRFHLIRYEDGSFLAMWQRCTHLGCSVPWVEGENQFHCPCHGSLYDRKGLVAGGPAPRPMDTFPVSIQNGQVYVDTGSPMTRAAFDPKQTTQA
jgi:cytochrome b6-f complex iron-sulfur subunit